MKKLFGYLVAVAVCILWNSCNGKPLETESQSSVIFVYMAGDNNLSGEIESNLRAMNRSLGNSNANCRIVAFADRKSGNPSMLYLDGSTIDTLLVYPEMDSSDSQTLAITVNYVLDNFKADSYGLILWSHGMGWLPTDQLHYLANNLGYAPGRDGCASASYLEGIRNPFYPTRSFGFESSGSKKYTAMEIQDLANAIPDNAFNFIAFDACYMGCIEVAYELKEKTRYVISSTAEIVSRGFPYSILTAYLAKGELVNACRSFYEYYDDMSGWQRMGCISLVRTSELDSLASCMKKIMGAANLPVRQKDLIGVQYYDRFGYRIEDYESGKSFYTHNVFHDLGDVAAFLCTDNDVLSEFNRQMSRCILYAESTPYIFYGTDDQIAIENHSGLSVYVPTVEYVNEGLNDDHMLTKWGQAVGY